eukprot:m.34428 g.34428  ORF g.34428 m.34428 type:complete len:227 (-) comp5215_c0_seq1:58-738(-)
MRAPHHPTVLLLALTAAALCAALPGGAALLGNAVPLRSNMPPQPEHADTCALLLGRTFNATGAFGETTFTPRPVPPWNPHTCICDVTPAEILSHKAAVGVAFNGSAHMTRCINGSQWAENCAALDTTLSLSGGCMASHLWMNRSSACADPMYAELTVCNCTGATPCYHAGSGDCMAPRDGEKCWHLSDNITFFTVDCRKVDIFVTIACDIKGVAFVNTLLNTRTAP